MPVTSHVVVPFDRDDEGSLVPGEAREAPNGKAARRRAHALSARHAAALACKRAGDPDSGELAAGAVIAVYGAGALQG